VRRLLGKEHNAYFPLPHPWPPKCQASKILTTVQNHFKHFKDILVKMSVLEEKFNSWQNHNVFLIICCDINSVALVCLAKFYHFKEGLHKRLSLKLSKNTKKFTPSDFKSLACKTHLLKYLRFDLG
jgi:hypothetical protein